MQLGTPCFVDILGGLLLSEEMEKDVRNVMRVQRAGRVMGWGNARGRICGLDVK